MSRANVVRMTLTCALRELFETSLPVGLLYSCLIMEDNTTSSPSSTANLNPPPLGSLDTTILVLFGVIAAASFVFNLLFCIVLLRKPSMLRKPHNILLFSLAVADMLTGEININELTNL